MSEWDLERRIHCADGHRAQGHHALAECLDRSIECDLIRAIDAGWHPCRCRRNVAWRWFRDLDQARAAKD